MVTEKTVPTQEEARKMLSGAYELSCGQGAFCPRCGKPIVCDNFGSSYTVHCIDDSCISVVARGI